jgi:hypothetical protein
MTVGRAATTASIHKTGHMPGFFSWRCSDRSFLEPFRVHGAGRICGQ